MNQIVPIANSFFDKPPVDVAPDDIIVFTCLRNEAARLPFFFDYYRNLGVKHFFVVDNGSDDGSDTIIRAQPDAHYFHTKGSYKGSAAGRLWTQELARHYGLDRWCLTVDVDELLVYPFIEQTSLSELCAELEREGARGLFCVFLDMYSDKPLSQTIYQSGEDFRSTCPFYEVDTYSLANGRNPPFLAVRGGPRWRLIWERDQVLGGPMQKKIPLVKWAPGFTYLYSTHSHSQLQLSFTTGVLQHFKFFSFFSDLSKREAERGDRSQTQDYSKYSTRLADDPNFLTPSSRRYTHSNNYLADGIMCISNSWRNWTRANKAINMPLGVNANTTQDNSGLLNPGGSHLGLSALSRVWPMLNNASLIRSTQVQPKKTKFKDSFALLVQLAAQIELMDVQDNVLKIKLSPNIWIYQGLSFGLAVFVDNVFVQSFVLDVEPDATQGVDTSSLEPNVYNFTLDREHLHRLTGCSVTMRTLRIHLIELSPQNHDTSPYNSGWSRCPTIGEFKSHDLLCTPTTIGQPVCEQGHFDGACLKVVDGYLTGWATRYVGRRRKLRLAVYLNDTFVGNFGARLVSSKAEMKYVFSIPLPLKFFAANGVSDFTARVRIANSNLTLRNCPAKWSGTSALWDENDESWKAAQFGQFERLAARRNQVVRDIPSGFKSWFARQLTPTQLRMVRFLYHRMLAIYTKLWSSHTIEHQ